MHEKREADDLANPSDKNPVLKEYIIIIYDLRNLSPVKKIGISHKLFGHSQKKNGKVYEFGGIVKAMNGFKLGRGAIMIPAEDKDDMFRFLESHSIRYEIKKVWLEDK